MDKYDVPQQIANQNNPFLPINKGPSSVNTNYHVNLTNKANDLYKNF